MKDNFIMQLSPFICPGAVLLAALALPGAVRSQTATAFAVPDIKVSPLATARTIQVHETLLQGSGKTLSAVSVDVTIQKPDKIKVVTTSPQNKRPDLYVRDGKNEYQYDGQTNTYRADVLPANGKSEAGVNSVTLADFLLAGGHFAPPGKGITRTPSTDIVNGRRMNTWTDTQAVGEGAETAKVNGRTWVDAKTHLPYRVQLIIVRAGGSSTFTVMDLTFSAWKFDKPIPAARLAWTPPAGAVLTKPIELLAVGTPAPDFTAIAPDGHKVHLSDYKGKTVVLDFWATWCGPCQKSMPNLEKVYQQVKDKDVVVLGVCVLDGEVPYHKWLTAQGRAYTFQTAYDPAGPGKNSIASSLYKVSSIPTQYVIDKDGKIAAVYEGYYKDDTRLEKALTAQGVAVALPAKTASVEAVPTKAP